MTRNFLCGIAMAALAGAALAQGAIGRVTKVSGLVTVSDATTVKSVVVDAAVVAGTRYVTSSTGTLTLVIDTQDRDCTINLQPNQSLTVEPNMNCSQMMALVRFLPGTAGTAVAGAGSVAAPGGSSFAQAIAILGAGILLMNSGGSGAAPTGGGGGGQLPDLSGQ